MGDTQSSGQSKLDDHMLNNDDRLLQLCKPQLISHQLQLPAVISWQYCSGD